MKKNRLTRIKISFLIAAILLVSLSFYSYIRINNLMKTAAWVNHTATVKLNLETYYSSIKGMESSMRGFFLIKDSMYVREFNLALAESELTFKKLKQSTNDNYSQRTNLAKLEQIARVRIANMKILIALGDIKKVDPSKRPGYRANRRELRSQIDKMMDEEEMLLKIRKKSLLKESNLTPIFAAFLTICSIIILIVSYYAIYLELKTSNLLRADLEDKNDSLEKMNQELESFTYISSHDLQEPLRKIQTFVSILIEKESAALSETGKNYLKRSQDSANRMQNLIRDLLAYSRLSVEIFPVESVSLHALVDEIKYDFDEEIKAKGVTISVSGEPETKIIVSQFRQLLINLISNSIKFSNPDTKPEIMITNEFIAGTSVPVEGAVPDQNYYKISVADNGIGFESQYKDRIFKVFQRLHIDQNYKGTGIGLAIVKKIADNHNGFITADSETGKGATFTIYLPA